MEMEKPASRGVAGTALGLAIGSVGYELLRGGFGGRGHGYGQPSEG